MRAKTFIEQIDDSQIVASIRNAELKTSGEIRVFVTRKEVQDPVKAAERQFLKLRMERTRERNGVLIYVAPRSQQFAVFGDSGIHTRCGNEFWTKVAAGVAEHFKRGDFTQGLKHAIQNAGKALAEHFPRRPDDTNELSDRVAHD